MLQPPSTLLRKCTHTGTHNVVLADTRDIGTSWFGTLLWALLVCNCSDKNVMSKSEKIIASLWALPQCGAFILASSPDQTCLAFKRWQDTLPTYFSSQQYPLTSGLSGGSCVATTPRLLAPFEFWLRYLEERRRLVIKRKRHPMRS